MYCKTFLVPNHNSNQILPFFLDNEESGNKWLKKSNFVLDFENKYNEY